MTRDEILKLHELSEPEQKRKLIQWNVLDSEPYENSIQSGLRPIESLADCAFRLRDEFIKTHEKDSDLLQWKGIWAWKEAIKKLLDAGVYRSGTWTGKAKPIHWIQAALLAKGETE